MSKKFHKSFSEKALRAMLCLLFVGAMAPASAQTTRKGVLIIGNGAFSGCTKLKKVIVPNIAEWCKVSCYSPYSNPLSYAHHLYSNEDTEITNLVIPEGVTRIGSYAFEGCSSLTSVTIPNSVNDVGSEPFQDCNGLKSVTINCSNVYTWFSGKSSIQEVTLGDKVTYIAENAFKNCPNITGLNIGCMDINENAFNGFNNLKKIVLSANVASIGSKAFANCPHLENVYCYAVRYPIANDDAFYGSYPDYVTLHVPEESVNNYRKNSPWNSFKEIVAIKPTTSREVTLSNAGYATFYDSQVSYTLPNGLKAYVVTSVENDKLTYERVKAGNQSGIVPKGVAVVLKSDQKQAGVYTLTRTDSGAQYTGDNLLHGSDETTLTTADENCCYYKLAYGAAGTDLANVFGWYWGAVNGTVFTIEGHKAWLAIPKEQANHVKSFSIEGESTAIADVEDEMQSADKAVYYDLQGRRISRPAQRGIYIRNGKKVALFK